MRLGQWSQHFYLRQRDELGIDSGFTAQGYLLPCFTEAEVTAARERMAMQLDLGLDVEWLSPDGWISATRPWPPGRPWAAPSARTTATSPRRAT